MNLVLATGFAAEANGWNWDSITNASAWQCQSLQGNNIGKKVQGGLAKTLKTTEGKATGILQCRNG